MKARNQEQRLVYLAYLKVKIKDDDFYSIDKLINRTELRNTIIRSFWEGLKYSDHSYEKKKEIVCTNFIITKALVERIITRNC